MKIRIKRSRTTKQLSLTSSPELKSNIAAEIIASNEDLLMEILLHLPIRSLIYLKSVSKHWLSLITNPRFSLLRNPLPLPVSALFLHRPSFLANPEYEFVPLNKNHPKSPTSAPFKTLTFVNDPSGVRILHSCNGLLCCSSFRVRESNRKYYIYNPTTKQFTTLPQLSRDGVSRDVCGMSLAFDPSKSPHYKVVCVRRSEMSPGHFQIEIYSSETGPWRVSGEPFIAHSHTNFKGGVYWNGSIHWINDWGVPDFLYFNVDEARLETMPMPPDVSCWIDKKDIYFMESNDHLHLIDVYPTSALLNVYEMKRDYSEWFVKYEVDLEPVSNVFSEMIIKLYYSTGCEIDVKDYAFGILSLGGEIDVKDYAFGILSLVRREKEEEDDSFLVLEIPGKAIRYNLVDKCFEELCEFAPLGPADIESRLRFGGCSKAFQYIESLAGV